MIDFQKLKREWKTFALGVATSIVGLYDVVVEVARTYGYDYTQLIKAEYRLYVVPAVAVAFLALRKWTSTPIEKDDVDPQ
jgi:hypothetical protein